MPQGARGRPPGMTQATGRAVGPAGVTPGGGGGLGTGSKRPTQTWEAGEVGEGGPVSCRPGELPPVSARQGLTGGRGGLAAPGQSLVRSFQSVFQACSAELPQAAGQMPGSWGVLC